MSTKEKIFDIWDYVDKSKSRTKKVFSGIHHKNGFRIASDCYVLIVERSNYHRKLEGKTILKSGAFINDDYPNYLSVIPKTSNDVVNLDITKIRDKIREHQAKEDAYRFLSKDVKAKLDIEQIPKNGVICLRDIDVHFNMHHFKKFINAVEAKKMTVYYDSKDKTRPIVAHNEQGDICVLIAANSGLIAYSDIYDV